MSSFTYGHLAAEALDTETRYIKSRENYAGCRWHAVAFSEPRREKTGKPTCPDHQAAFQRFPVSRAARHIRYPADCIRRGRFLVTEDVRTPFLSTLDRRCAGSVPILTNVALDQCEFVAMLGAVEDLNVHFRRKIEKT